MARLHIIVLPRGCRTVELKRRRLHVTRHLSLFTALNAPRVQPFVMRGPKYRTCIGCRASWVLHLRGQASVTSWAHQRRWAPAIIQWSRVCDIRLSLREYDLKEYRDVGSCSFRSSGFVDRCWQP